MKRVVLMITTCIFPFILNLSSISAMEMPGHDGKGHSMDHPTRMGENIRETTVNGHMLAYHLIDMAAKMEGMTSMPPMMATHHMMVYIMTPDGKMVKDAKTGFVIEDPDKKKQQVMAMGMGDGYGSDITLKKKGTYKIAVKIVREGKSFMDVFAYEVK